MDGILPFGMQGEGWIVSRDFDVRWFFGGVMASLLFVALALARAVPMVLLFWIWLLAFDGPHMAAAYTRTYLDRDEWQRTPRRILAPLLSFLIGPACLLLGVVSRSPVPFQLFLAVATVYGYYHLVRQHYGFLALYRSVGHEREGFLRDKWCLYIGAWAPYVYFVVTHPHARALLGLPASPGDLAHAAGGLLVAAWGASLAVFLVGQRMRAERNTAKTIYVVATILLHGAAYFFIARFEPVYAASRGPDQDFLLLSVMLTVFHNVEYIALVWVHNQKKYRSQGDWGPARSVSRSAPRYLAALASFSFVYLAMASATGVYPVFQSFTQVTFGSVTANQVGLALWWGISVHHYWLDQKIWRVGSDPRLRSYLGIA